MTQLQSDPAISFEHAHLDQPCPACGRAGLDAFCTLNAVPVPVTLLPTRPEALDPPVGRIQLAACPACGFIGNAAFDPSLAEAAARLDESAHIPPINAFARDLARQWIDRYELHRRQLLEIGCGRGDFLVLMCELGTNYGVGIDPAYVPHRITSEAARRVQFIQDIYSEKYADLIADFVCCRHILQHVSAPGEFLRMLRRAMRQRREAIVAFELPNVLRTLRNGAFWDLCYAHCSHFTAGSLSRLLRATSFDVMQAPRTGDEASVVLEARPAGNPTAPSSPLEDDLDQIAQAVRAFPDRCSDQRRRWQERVDRSVRLGRRMVAWDTGPATIGFLSALRLGADRLEYVVDPHPHRQGGYLPGTGQQAVLPAFLKGYPPDQIIVADPLIVDDVRAEVRKLGIEAELVVV